VNLASSIGDGGGVGFPGPDQRVCVAFDWFPRCVCIGKGRKTSTKVVGRGSGVSDAKRILYLLGKEARFIKPAFHGRKVHFDQTIFLGTAVVY
jgi:hypothetical protein